MATDQKLVAQLLDLSRNVEKLSGEIKKNTTVNKDLVKADSSETKSADESKDIGKIAEGLKSLDFKGLKDEFKGLKEGLKGIDKLDFKGLENGLKSLDFKGLEKGIKGLDFKGVTESLKGFDVKGITESFKGISDLKNIDLGGITKNLTSGAGVKDFISGSVGNIGKGLLGGFASGGVVKNPGAYLVGEKGPEIAKLPKDTTVIPNDKTESILSGKPAAIGTKTKSGKYPSAEQIEAKKRDLISSDPQFYSDPMELADEIEYYINNYKNENNQETFTKEDIAKLGKSTPKSPAEQTSEIKKTADDLTKVKTSENKTDSKNKAEISEKKPGLFSKIFSKENIKNIVGKLETGASGLLGGGNLKDKFTGSLKGSAESLINKSSLNIPDFAKNSITSNLSFLNKGSKEAFGDLGISGVDIKKNLPSLSNLPSIKAKSEQTAQKNEAAPVTKPVQANEIQTSGTTTGNTMETSSVSTKDNVESKPQDESGITKKDIDTMIAALNRMASLLEGPLSVTSLDYPIRPDSRRI